MTQLITKLDYKVICFKRRLNKCSEDSTVFFLTSVSCGISSGTIALIRILETSEEAY